MKKKIGCALLALTSAFAVNMSYDVPEMDVVGISNSLMLALYKFINIFANDMRNKGWMITILFCLFFACYHEVFVVKRVAKVRHASGLAAFFAVMYTAGQAFAYSNSLTAVLHSSIRLIKFALQLVGFFGIFWLAITMLYAALTSKKDIKIGVKLQKLVDKAPYWSYFVVIMVVWLANLLVRFPGLMSYDNRHQLAYYFGFETFSDIQPVFHTWLFGFIVNLGMKLGSANQGLFLFVLLQSVVLALILAYSLYLMKKYAAPVWLRVLTLAVYVIAPYYTSYIAFPIKDMLYVACFVLFMLILIQFVTEKEISEQTASGSVFANRKNCMLLVLAGTFMILFRNNGLYVYIPTAVVLGIMMIRKIGKGAWKQIAIRVVVLFLPLVLSKGVTLVISSAYDVQPNSSAEVFSITYQQIGRYVRDYGDDVSDADKEAIAKVLDYEHLAENYNELTADPIKSTFNGEASRSELMGYFAAWGRGFLKHPICYVEATWNQNYYLFTPNIDNIIFNRDCYVGEEVVEEMGLNSFVKVSIPSAMTGFVDIMYYWYALLVSMPVIGLFSNVAFYVMVFFAVMLFMKNHHMKKEMLVLVPLVLALLMVIAAPQIQNQPRYAFPLIYTMPSLVAMVVVRMKGEVQK